MTSFLDSFSFSDDLSLYIHVPFCISKCSYCGFYSLPGCSQGLMDGYLERLLSEIKAVTDRMAPKPFLTAFIGGGNPGCLGAERLGKIAKAVCSNGRPSEFSVEMNPESLSEDFFPLFKDRFTRLSMGIQSMDPKALRFLGRNADQEKTLRGLGLSQQLKALTGCSLSYDLITCLGDWHDEISDVKALMENYPSDHLSVYALTLEEGTPMAERHPDLPDPDQQYDVLKRVWDELGKNGYSHYEVSNFAKPGHECLHNCRYWGYRQYLGLGPGAASTAFSEAGKVTRYNFLPSVKDYVSGKLFSGFEAEYLTRQESLEELSFMGLRYFKGLDLERAFYFAGKEMNESDLEVLDRIHGFCVRDGFLVPDQEGLMLSDAAASEVLDILC